MKTFMLVWLISGTPINATMYASAEACNKALIKVGEVPRGVELKCAHITSIKFN